MNRILSKSKKGFQKWLVQGSKSFLKKKNEKKPQHECEQIKNLLDDEKQRLVYVYKKLM